MKLLRSLSLSLLLPGCVMIDSKISEIHPAATGPESFHGVYGNGASYRSSGGGLNAQNYLQEYLGCQAFPDVATEVRIRGTSDKLEAEIRFRDGRVEKRTLTVGRDCTFKDGYLLFSGKLTGSGGNDSPSLGYISTSRARWTIDRDGNLVVISNDAAVGTVTIIPVAMATRWMAVFPRKKEAGAGR